MNLGNALKYVMTKLLTGGNPLPPGMKIGKSVKINRTAIFDQRFGKHITLCDGARIGYNALLLCHDSSASARTGLIWVAPITVGERAYIGANAVIMPGVKVGKDAIVAAGAVVTKDVEPGDIVAGIPAKPIGRTEEFDRKQLEDVKSKKSFDSKVVYSESKRTRDSVISEQLQAVEKDGGYYVRFETE
jgi:serine acetyltransferase